MTGLSRLHVTIDTSPLDTQLSELAEVLKGGADIVEDLPLSLLDRIAGFLEQVAVTAATTASADVLAACRIRFGDRLPELVSAIRAGDRDRLFHLVNSIGCSSLPMVAEAGPGVTPGPVEGGR